MIPKKIHYCWFGRNPKPQLAEKCINSWRKYCPDYKIIEWNEENFDIVSAPLYVRQAYEAKKWAFVTDYVRLWAMVLYGGIYMDTDVEVLRSLDDLLTNRAFSGFEAVDRIPTGIMACEKGFPLFQDFLREYDEARFLKEDESLDLTTNVTRITNECFGRGLKLDGSLQEIEGFVIYPKDYFCPKFGYGGKITVTMHTYTIHHFSASWATKQQKKHWKEINSFPNVYRFKWRILRWGSIIGRTLFGDEKWKKITGKQNE